jgi:hypothetical protein
MSFKQHFQRHNNLPFLFLSAQKSNSSKNNNNGSGNGHLKNGGHSPVCKQCSI